jgi:Glycosyl hydrolase family 26
LVAFALLLAAAASAPAAIYFGATISGETYGQTGNAPRNGAAWDLFERHAGKPVAIVNQGQTWCSFDKGEVEATAARGAIPLVTMGLGSGVTIEQVASGLQDAAIKKWAQEAKAWGRPFFFAPWWEMNGAWYAWGRNPKFVAAWRHFHDVVVAQGATNVTWTWVVNSIWSDPESNPAPYYPGDAYVDWTGLDSYNWGRNPAQPDRWINPEQTMTPTLKIIEGVAPTKPIAIVEDAASEYGGNKTDWIREMLTTYLPHHPRIGAYLWFNWNFPKNGTRHDWQIESSAPAQQQFRQAIQSSIYVPRPLSLPNLTKVPPPSAGAADPAQTADLSGPAEMATGSDVAVAPNGTATVVWSARTSGTFAVDMRRIAPNGTRGPVVQLSAAGEDALAPQVAVAPDGTATVVWIRSDGSTFLVQARRVDPAGTPAASTKDLSRTAGDAADPQVAVGSDGTATVVWKRWDGFHDRIEERRLTPAGEQLPAEGANLLSAAGGDAVEPGVATAADGSSTVVWDRFDEAHTIVQEHRIDPAGAPEGATVDLSGAGENAVEPGVAIDPLGWPTVVWDRFDGSNWVIQGQRLGPIGALEGAVQNLSAPGRDAAEPQLAIDPLGRATVVWDRFDGSNFVVQARRLDSSGLAAPVQNLSASGRDAAEPQLAISLGGTATVLWSRFDGSNFVVQHRDIAADGSLSTTENLSPAGRRASAPAVAWGSDGTLAMTWRRFAGAGDVVQAKTTFQPQSPLIPVPPPPVPPPPAPPSGSQVRSAAAPAPASLQIGKPRLNRKRGTAILPITVSGPGVVQLGGALPRRISAPAAGEVKLLVVPKRAQRRQLLRQGSLRLPVIVTFQPLGGSAISRRLTLGLTRARLERA